MAKSGETATTAITRREPTPGEKFTNLVIREFGTTVSDSIEMTPYQRNLAKHLFIKIDTTLKELDAKRTGDRQPIVWNNINMQKLALDAVHRIDLGLDALIGNHIHPIPYWNSRAGKYDLDLRIGYMGKDLYRRRMAVEEPRDIIYELVYSTDKFRPIKRTLNNSVESYEFEITKPFDRGEIIGGFGYIVYGDNCKNQLVIVSEKDFQKSRALAKTPDFWTRSPIEMRYKTLILRVTEKLQVDPKKVNVSYLAVEAADDERAEEEIATEIAEKANKEFIDVDTGEIIEERATPGEAVETSPLEGEEKAIGARAPKKPPKLKRDLASIHSLSELFAACHQDWGMQPNQVIKELGYNTQSEVVELPSECYIKIRATREEPGF